MNFDLTKPCVDCPFLEPRKFYLTPGRVTEIEQSITTHQQTFACHKTVKELGSTAKEEQHCAGALIMLERMGRPNQLMRIAERLGMYDRSKLDMAAPIYASFAAMRRAMQKLNPRRKVKA